MQKDRKGWVCRIVIWEWERGTVWRMVGLKFYILLSGTRCIWCPRFSNGVDSYWTASRYATAHIPALKWNSFHNQMIRYTRWWSCSFHQTVNRYPYRYIHNFDTIWSICYVRFSDRNSDCVYVQCTLSVDRNNFFFFNLMWSMCLTKQNYFFACATRSTEKNA